MDSSINALKDKLQAEIRQAERLKSDLPTDRSDSEIRRFQLDSTVGSARKQLDSLDALQRGQRNRPEWEGSPT